MKQTAVQPSTISTPAPVFRPCPHDQIIDLYHELLPMGRRVKKPQWNGAQAQALTSRWREDPERQSAVWWAWFFQRIAKSSFLTGLVSPRHGGKPFELDLGWIIAPSNFMQILRGVYD